jgi:hypothetical protein
MLKLSSNCYWIVKNLNHRVVTILIVSNSIYLSHIITGEDSDVLNERLRRDLSGGSGIHSLNIQIGLLVF